MKAHCFISLLFIFLLPLASTATTAAQRHEQELNNEAATPGRYYALVIGNNAYQKIRRLKTAEDDAREVELLLKERYGFSTKLLLNATRQQIISALNFYRRELDSSDSLMIYYAGHGVNDSDADKAYWLPVDASLDDSANWISADDITTNVRVIPARHVLIVSDSCYSGTLTRTIEPSIAAPLLRQRYLQKMIMGKSRTLMASGGNEPVADSGGGSHSVFANALLRGLTQINEGMFTASELFQRYVQESVAGGAEQTPEYNPLRNSGHDSGDFVFMRKNGDTAIAQTPNTTQHIAKTSTDARVTATTEVPKAHDTSHRADASVSSDSQASLRNTLSSLAGTTWTGSSPEAGEYAISFLKDNQVQYTIKVLANGVASPKTVKGKWKQSGSNIQIIIGDYYSIWQGTIEGDIIKGEGNNRAGDRWNWTLFKKE